MAYTTVPTKSAGETWSATDHNTYVKDNFAAAVPDIFTAKGDLAVASAADAAGPLAVGTNGQVLVADSAQTYGVKWASGQTHVARYKVNATKSASTGAYTIVQFDTSVFDPDSAVTTGTAWKYTVPTGAGGYYFIAASAVLQASTNWAVNEYAALFLYKNNSVHAAMGGYYAPNAAGTAYRIFLHGTMLISLAAADYIDVRLYHGSGATETIDSDGDYGHIAIAKLF